MDHTPTPQATQERVSLRVQVRDLRAVCEAQRDIIGELSTRLTASEAQCWHLEHRVSQLEQQVAHKESQS